MLYAEDYRLPKMGRGELIRSVFDRQLMAGVYDEDTRSYNSALERLPEEIGEARDLTEAVDVLRGRNCAATAEVIEGLGILAATKREGLNRINARHQPIGDFKPRRNTDPKPNMQFIVCISGVLMYQLPLKHHPGYRYQFTSGPARIGSVICLNNLSTSIKARPSYGIDTSCTPYSGEGLELTYS